MLGGHGRARSVLEHRDLPISVGKGIPTGACCGDGTVTHLGNTSPGMQPGALALAMHGTGQGRHLGGAGRVFT